MDMRIQPDAGRDHTGSDVRAVFNVNAAIGAKFRGISGAVEVQMGDAFRRKGITEDRVKQLHVQFATDACPPAGMGIVFERAGDIQ